MDVLLDLLMVIRNYLIYWSPSVVGVLVGGFIIQRYWVRKANESALIEYLTKELSDLVDETLDYWSLDCSGTDKLGDQNRQQARKLEQKIKGAIKNLNSVLRQYSERYCKNINFTDLMAEVSESCTGGKFEVKKRPADPERYLHIVNATHRVRSKLFERRV